MSNPEDINTDDVDKPKKCNPLVWITLVLLLIVIIIVYTILRFSRTIGQFPFLPTQGLQESTNYLATHLFNQIVFL